MDIVGGMAISQYKRKMANFAFHFVCYDWDSSNYGYGGDKDGNGVILTTSPMTFNYESSHQISKLSSNNGSIITIDNELRNRDVRFKFLCSQMQAPSTDYFQAGASTGFLNTGLWGTQYRSSADEEDINTGWEWMLTMKLYGIE